MSVGGAREWKDRGDRYSQARCLNRSRQTGEIARAVVGIVTRHANPTPPARLRLDAVRIRRPSAPSHEREASFQRIAAGERQHRVDSVRSELEQLVDDPWISRVDHGRGAEPA